MDYLPMIVNCDICGLPSKIPENRWATSCASFGCVVEILRPVLYNKRYVRLICHEKVNYQYVNVDDESVECFHCEEEFIIEPVVVEIRCNQKVYGTKRCTPLDDDLHKLKTELSEKEVAIGKLESENSYLSKEVKYLEQQRSTMDGKLQKLREDYEALQKSADNKEDILLKQIDRLTVANMNLSEVVEKLAGTPLQNTVGQRNIENLISDKKNLKSKEPIEERFEHENWENMIRQRQRHSLATANRFDEAYPFPDFPIFGKKECLNKKLPVVMEDVDFDDEPTVDHVFDRAPLEEDDQEKPKNMWSTSRRGYGRRKIPDFGITEHTIFDDDIGVISADYDYEKEVKPKQESIKKTRERTGSESSIESDDDGIYYDICNVIVEYDNAFENASFREGDEDKPDEYKEFVKATKAEGYGCRKIPDSRNLSDDEIGNVTRDYEFPDEEVEEIPPKQDPVKEAKEQVDSYKNEVSEHAEEDDFSENSWGNVTLDYDYEDASFEEETEVYKQEDNKEPVKETEKEEPCLSDGREGFEDGIADYPDTSFDTFDYYFEVENGRSHETEILPKNDLDKRTVKLIEINKILLLRIKELEEARE